MNIFCSKRKALKRGALLIEVTVAFGALLAVSLLLLKAAITCTTVQKWTVIQGLSDARMSQEVARAKRIPFDDFLLPGSDFPEYPIVDTSSVEIGRLPGSKPIMGTLRRTRLPMDNNLAVNGTAITNPTGTEGWQLQSYLTYKISARNYVKSRTVLRAR